MRRRWGSGTITQVATAILVIAVAAPVGAQPESVAPTGRPPLRMSDARVAHTSTSLSDGSVLIVGGMNGVATIGSAEVYDTAEGRFRSVGSLGIARAAHTATLLPDGRVLVIGGVAQARPLAAVEVYDPVSETFQRLGRLRSARTTHTATLLSDGRVLVAGGAAGRRDGRPSRSAELFDPATGRSEPVGSMRRARVGHTATLLEDGRVAIVGGLSDQGGRPRVIEVYDPATRRFSTTVPLPAEAYLHDTVRLDDGRLLVAGNPALMVVAADARATERVSESRSVGQRTATLAADGRVVLIGGVLDGPPTVWLFDPASESLSEAGSLALTRQAHRAARVGDGTILVAGGVGCSRILDSAEIWDPVDMTVVAGASSEDCEYEPMASPAPLAPLGATTTGGRVAMPGSAFAITLPDDWMVELADPDTDIFGAQPGTAWEALRATAPDGTSACWVALGVAGSSLSEGGHGTMSSTGEASVDWEMTERGLMLRVPEPRVVPGAEGYSSMAPRERLARDHEGLEHDALYSVHCAGDDKRAIERIAASLEFLDR